jgi:hypothetical protein
MTERACENCGFLDDELVLVRRVYVTPETWDQPGSETVVPEAELWCVSCCSQYPHDVVTDEEDADDVDERDEADDGDRPGS